MNYIKGSFPLLGVKRKKNWIQVAFCSINFIF